MAKRKKDITRIFVDGASIRKNQRTGSNEPTIRLERPAEKDNGEKYMKLEKAHEVIILGQDGKEAARVVFRPNEQRTQGQVVYIEAVNVEVSSNIK